jgi:hypothetical protein
MSFVKTTNNNTTMPYKSRSLDDLSHMFEDEQPRIVSVDLHGGDNNSERIYRKKGGAVELIEEDVKHCVKKKDGGKLDIKIKHPGSLHREMDIPEDKKIPMKDLKKEKTKAKREDDPSLMKKVNFAMNFRKGKK